MALQLSVNNPYNGISPEGYIKLSKIDLDLYHQTGEVKLYIWHDMEARQKSLPIGEINIKVGNSNIISNSTNALLQVKYIDVYEKSISDLYNIVKNNKVEFINQVLDLSLAQNI